MTNSLSEAVKRLRAIDGRAPVLLCISGLAALLALYMLLAAGAPVEGEIQAASRVHEPVDSIARFRAERERVRSVEIEQITKLVADESAGQAIRDKARERLMRLTEWMEQEVTVEGVMRARGYEDPLVTVHADSVNVLVRTSLLSQTDAARILELAARETGQAGGHIKIIPIE
jgi:hypothetical protein